LNETGNRRWGGEQGSRGGRRSLAKLWVAVGIAIAVVATAWLAYSYRQSDATASAAPAALPQVVVSKPLVREVESSLGFLGQFSAVEQVELRAQVGGTLTGIHFKDGDIVHQGDLLFTIDPRPYEIRLAQANAQLETANARLVLAGRELHRAEVLAAKAFGTEQTVDQRTADQRTGQAAVDDAKAQIRDAEFDLNHTRITAPFTGRIGSHLISVGNLIAGSRAGTSPTTLLATLVSIDPIYLNFDMSEADYMTFQRGRQQRKGPLADKLQISLADEKGFTHEGTLDFVDNTLDRSSGTIHARATVPNSDLLLTPGGFARVRLAVAPPALALLVPDASVLPDQSEHIVLIVGPNDVVTPKRVQLGDLRNGLRVIRSGLDPSDRVIIDGIPTVRPGSKVSPQSGSIRFASDQSRSSGEP
jgi:membrane fusion protein, multidrug efflux system